MSMHCLRFNTAHGNGSWNSEKHKKSWTTHLLPSGRISQYHESSRRVSCDLGGPQWCSRAGDEATQCLLPHFFVAKLEANDLADKREGGLIFVRFFRYRYVERSVIYLPKLERRQWADWNKSVHVGTCLEVSHMQPQLSAILSEWQHVKWTCVWALSRRVAPSWQSASAQVRKISSCHSAMWVATAKSPTLQSRPSSLGLFSIPSYEKISSG